MTNGEWRRWHLRSAAGPWLEGAVPTHCCASFCSRPLEKRNGTDALLCVVLQPTFIRKERRPCTAVRRYAAGPWLEGAVPTHCCASFCSQPLLENSAAHALLCVVLQPALIRKQRRPRTAVRRFAALLCIRLPAQSC
jgi:hypothetical protein